MIQRWCFLFLLLFAWEAVAQERSQPPVFSLVHADTFYQKRFWTAAGTGTAIYTGFAIGLWNAWYKNYELGPFHLFNDWGEWEDMDKVGHAMTAYNEARWIYNGARWTGMQEKKAIWTGVAGGMLLQSTIEFMDGFSEKWGFSTGDMLLNGVGVSSFALQQHYWGEQRIIMKVSSYQRPKYATLPIASLDGNHSTTLDRRAGELYGTGFFEVFLKDYNAQTYWFSFSPNAFRAPSTRSRLPDWLAVSVGYGAQNMYAGFDYSFEDAEGNRYELDPAEYPRYRQFYLSLDVDFTRIPTRRPWLRSVFAAINFLKVPAPSLEINTLGQARWHWLHL